VIDRLTLTVPEAANALGLGRNTVYDLIRQGHLPHLRVGRIIRVPQAALTEWITSNTQKGTTP
jgi:excisionase family DNA binding protein